MGIQNDTFKPTMFQKFSSIKVYNTLAVPILLHGSEIWTLRKKDKKQLTSIEMTVFRTATRNTLLDHKRNQAILEDMKVESDDEKLRRCKSDWL
jgi:hypothetical protein